MIYVRQKYLILFILLLFALPLKANDQLQPRIAILYSGFTEKINEEFIPKVIDQITYWEIFLMQNKIAYSVIYDKDLERGISEDFDILILPSVYAISEKELKSLKNFLDDGNSILNMGSKLSYDEDQNYKNLDYLFELLGIQFNEYNGKDLSLLQYLDQNPIFINQNIEKPIIQVSPKYQPLICNLKSNNFNHIGYLKTADETSLQTLLIYGKSGNGKFVNIGFNFSDITDGKEIINPLIINSLKWLDKIPDVYIKNFPDDYNKATIVLLENNTGLKPELIDQLNANGIEPYLVFTPGEKLDDAITDKIKDDHFIADLRSSIFDSSEINVNKPSFLTDEINQLNKKIVAAFLSDQMISNYNLISILKGTGIKIFLFNQYFQAFPELTNDKDLFIPNYTAKTNENVESTINLITYKSKIDCETNIEKEFVDDVLKSKTYNNWYCTLNELKEWYELKSNITFSISDVTENNFDITISNNSVDRINGINLLVNLPANIKPELLDIKSGSGFIDYTIDGMNQLNLMINEVNPRQLKKINLSFYTK